MFIVFGASSAEAPVKDGLSLVKWCPKCDCNTVMTEWRVEEYSTLFFIRLSTTPRGDSYLKCQRCSTSYVLTDRDFRDAGRSQPHQQDILRCIKCGKKMRVPIMEETLEVTCPHCKAVLLCEKDT